MRTAGTAGSCCPGTQPTQRRRGTLGKPSSKALSFPSTFVPAIKRSGRSINTGLEYCYESCNDFLTIKRTGADTTTNYRNFQDIQVRFRNNPVNPPASVRDAPTISAHVVYTTRINNYNTHRVTNVGARISQAVQNGWKLRLESRNQAAIDF